MVGTITNTGCNEIRDWLAGTSATAPTHMAIGTSDSVPATSDTTMGSEIARAAIETTTPTDKQVKYSYTLPFTSSNGNALKEVGLLNASSAGDLFFRGIHTAINKTTSIEIEYEVSLRISQGE